MDKIEFAKINCINSIKEFLDKVTADITVPIVITGWNKMPELYFLYDNEKQSKKSTSLHRLYERYHIRKALPDVEKYIVHKDNLTVPSEKMWKTLGKDPIMIQKTSKRIFVTTSNGIESTLKIF